MLLLVVDLLAFGARSLEAAPAIRLETVAAGLVTPIFVTNAGDGTNRLFIVERGGTIKVLQPGVSTPTIVLNIETKVLSGGEQGLLGLAFHPQFASNRRFFVNYTRQTDGATVVAEYQVSPSDGNVADPTSERIFLVIAHPGFGNHNGGMIEFGPDTFLYIATGDGGSSNDPASRAQNINDLHGKILRIDVDHASSPLLYSSPSSNPFFGSTPGADEIYALGLRHPWRFSFDRDTGQLYAADVGQGAIEEVDIITLGANYGWRIYEGTRCTGNDPGLCNPAGFTFPIIEYGHNVGRCSITGGHVYRGTQASLPFGSYIYGDFCTGEIFVFANGTTNVALDTGLSVASFGEDESGELYVVNFWGEVYRIAIAVSPAATTLIAPTGTISSPGSSVTPAFSWNAVPTASYYYLWVNDSSAAPKITQWVSTRDGACGSGTGTCSFTPSATLNLGPARWWIRTWNSAGYGSWSVALDFTASVPPLGAAALISPSGSSSTSTPTYVWAAVAGASYYYLWVNDWTATPKITQWVSSSAAGCANGTGTCSATPSTAVSAGGVRWWIRAWNASQGYGPWSIPADFTR